LQPIRDDARRAIDIAAGRIGHDQFDNARGPFLGCRRAINQRRNNGCSDP
jgi:hypothetical protein